MNKLTNINLIYKDNKSKTKDEVLESISKKALEQKIVQDDLVVLDSLRKREKEFSTGMGDHLAIPHGEVKGLKKPTILVLDVKDIEWDSLDKKPVKTVVCILVPKGQGDSHLQILSEFSRRMANDSFMKTIKSGKAEDIVKAINEVTINEDKTEVKDSKKGKGLIVGITACPVGIAHTFMAQQKIIDVAQQLGYEVKVETQGSEGQKDALTREEIAKAKAIVISTGIQLEGMERFDGFEGKIYSSELKNTIQNNVEVVKAALEQGKNFKSNGGGSNTQTSNISYQTKQSKGKEIVGHIMSGISAMIPVIIIAGLFMAIANIGALPWSIPDTETIWNGDWAAAQNGFVLLLHYINMMGMVMFKFMYPFFAAYLAYSIAGKLALAPAFLGGALAGGLHMIIIGSGDAFMQGDFWQWAYGGGSFEGSAFIGALIAGFFVGYLTRYLNQRIQVGPNWITLKTILIIPLIVSLSIFFLMEFAVNPFFGFINVQVANFFSSAGGAGAFGFQTLVAAGLAFDMGGPINKATGSISLAMCTDAYDNLQAVLSDPSHTDAELAEAVQAMKALSITGNQLGIVIPPIGLGLAATFGNRLTKRNLFTSEEQNLGSQAMFLGTIGISEGGLPFLLKNAIYVIPANVIGAIIGTWIALAFGSVYTLPMSPIWIWALTGTTVSGIAGFSPVFVQILGFFTAVIVGSIVTASIFISLLLVRDIIENREAKVYSIEKINQASEEDKQVLIEQNVKGIDIINDYLESLPLFGKGDAKKVKSIKNIEDENISLAKERGLLIDASKELTKLTNKQRNREVSMRNINSLIQFKSDRNRDISKLQAKYKVKENELAEIKQAIAIEEINVANHIANRVEVLKEYKALSTK